MKTLFIAFKILLNVLLLLFYVLVSIIFGNFIFGLFLTIFDKVVPGKEDPIHIKIALLVVFLTLVITLLFRKFFYLSVFPGIKEVIMNSNSNNGSSKNETIKNEVNKSRLEPKEEELEIYVNKEIK